MAELRLKRTSYPSKQRRFGPAPLASFEDLSDEIPSPETNPDESTVEARGVFDLTPDLRFELPDGNETEEDDVRTFSDGITPSTPRVLVQTPSTPITLQDFSTVGTPDIFVEQSTSVLSEFAVSPPNDLSPPKVPEDPYNIFSPRNSPVLERRPFNLNVDVIQEKISIISQVIDPAADRALAAAAETDDNTDVKDLNVTSSGTGSIRSRPGSGTGSGSRIGSATPSPRSARKLFTMSFFKPREDRSPSPLASPKSPLKLSPMASPKSPRRSSPFGLSLFRSHVKDDIGDQSPSSSSPTKKKSHFPSFLRGKETVKSPVAEPGKSKDGKHSPGVFSTLFRRDHRYGHRAADGKTPEEEEWISFSRSHISQGEKCKAISSEDIETDYVNDEVASPTSPVDPYHGGIYINIFERSSSPPDTEIVRIENEPDSLLSELLPELNNGVSASMFESSQDIVNFCVHHEQYDPSLRLGISPSSDLAAEEAKPKQSEVVIQQSTATSENLQVIPIVEKLSLEEKLSPDSEREVSEIELKFVKTEEPEPETETETLLREDSFENENDSGASSALVQILAERESELSEISKRRERIATFQPHPVDRPRCIVPISYSSLEEYVSFVSKSPVASVSDESPVTTVDGVLDAKAKLKVTLPKEEFQLKQRQSRKSLFKSWVEFCEVGLQSPRTRRRHLSDKSLRSASSMPTSRTATVEEDGDRRTESLDYTLSGAGCEVWTTFETTHSVEQHTSEISFESDVFAISNSDSKFGSVDITDSILSLKSPTTETSSTTYFCEPPSDSSRDSSPKEFVGIRENSAFMLNLGDEEVEPLVKEVLSRDVSREILVDDANNDPPYAITTSVLAPSVVPAHHFDDDDDDKYLGQQWWAGDNQSVVSMTKQHISNFSVIKPQSETVISETNGKTVSSKEDDIT